MVPHKITRKSFFASAGLPVALNALAPLEALAQTPASAKRLPMKKAVLVSMLPEKLTFQDKFQLAKDVGFEGIEGQTVEDAAEEAVIAKASELTGMPIHSVMNMAHWQYPLSSSDPAAVERSMAGMRTSLRNAAAWGSETVLLVPAVVNPATSYADAYKRSREQINKLIPEYEKKKVIIAVEEVWNKFLLSPLEFAKYVDDFQSPWVKAYFDVGNVVLFGYPQDWIRTLGSRIVKVHLKDFHNRRNTVIRKNVPEFVNLREGDIDWKEVHKAFHEIGFKGFATVELSRGDEKYLRDVSSRVDMIFNGE
jgi:L-ribulose-5-phosphate 3-epimerase